MKDVVRFFWEREKRAWQMDAANKEGGLPTPYWMESQEWVDAYKNTLSGNKRREFDKEWDKLEKELETYHNASPKQLKNLKSPMGL